MDTSYRRFGNAALAIRLTTLVLALWSAWAKPVAAATLYWDINGVTPGLGGAGTWNTANNFWNTSATGTGGTPSTWNNGALDHAVFDGAAGIVAVTLGTPITVHNLTLGASPSYTLGGSTLTLAGSTPTIDTLGNTHTIGSVVAGTPGLIKAGAGTLALTGSNTYTGATTVSAGTLSVGNGGSVGSIPGATAVSVASGATMAWNNANTTALRSIANPISGAGNVLLQGQNTASAFQTSVYTMSGNNAGFTGTWQLNRAIMWNNTSQSQLGAVLHRGDPGPGDARPQRRHLMRTISWWDRAPAGITTSAVAMGCWAPYAWRARTCSTAISRSTTPTTS